MNKSKTLPLENQDILIENDDLGEMDFGGTDALDNHMDEAVLPEESQWQA